MTRRFHATVIDEYLLLKRKVAKCVDKAKLHDKAILKQRKILESARRWIKRMLEIEHICRDNGWPHPDTFDSDYTDVFTKQSILNTDTFSKALLTPDGNRPDNMFTSFSSVADQLLTDLKYLADTNVLPPTDKKPSLFSPDGNRFVLNLENNTKETAD